MSLLSRLSGIPEPGQTYEDVKKIGFSQLVSAMAERKRGHISAAGIVAKFELTADEITQATALYNKLDALTNNAQREAFLSELQQILHLSELGFDGSADGGVNYGDLTSLQARINAI